MGSITIPKTMRAQQYDQRDNKLHLNTIPVPSPQPHELLVKVSCASLCHSDVMLFEPNDQGLILGNNPVTIGHEATGVVVQTGSGDVAGKFKQGDTGFSVDGYFQEFVVVDARETMVLPEGLDVRTAAPLFCAGVTAFHSVQDCDLEPGQWMAIVGCGGLGHMGIQYAKAMGYRVIGLDIAEQALEQAKKCGADHVLNSLTDKEWQKKVLQITGGGAHAVVNFTASKKSYDDAPAIIKAGVGLLMVVGIPRQPLEFNALDIALGRYRVKGANNGTCYNMKPAIEFSAKHNIQPHLTTFKLEEVPKMIELMNSHKAQGRMGVLFD